MARQHDGTAGHIGVHPPYRLISVDTVMPATMVVAVYSMGSVAMALLASMMLPLGIIVLVTGNLSRPGLNLVLGVAGVFAAFASSLAAAVLSFTRLNFWTQVDLKRQAAAHGDRTRVRLATVQPAIETAALTEPLMVGARMRRPVVIAIRAVIALPVVLVVMAGLAAFTSDIPHGSIWTPLIVILTCALWLLRLLAKLESVLRDLREGQRISADEQGITFRLIGEPRHISWREARLFAIYRGNPQRPPRWYDVSSANAVLHWAWLRPGTLLALLFEPTVPFEEYDRRLERLLSLIAARTELPLYDLC